MFKMLAQLWSMLSTFFQAGENLALATNALTTYAKEAADDLLMERRIESAKKLKLIQQEAPALENK